MHGKHWARCLPRDTDGSVHTQVKYTSVLFKSASASVVPELRLPTGHLTGLREWHLLGSTGMKVPPNMPFLQVVPATWHGPVSPWTPVAVSCPPRGAVRVLPGP